MNWVDLIIAFVPTIIKIFNYIIAAEEKFGDGTGEQKKEFVKEKISEVATDVAVGVEMVSTGGQKETWQQINYLHKNMPLLDSLINFGAWLLYRPKEKPTDDPQVH